jgi:exopolysaccharide transport family protein
MTIQKSIPPSPTDVFHDRHLEAEAAPERDGFDLLDLLRVVRVRRMLILGTTLIVIALTATTVMLLKPVYSATAAVMLEQRKNTVEDAGAVLSDMPTDQTAVQNQVQILTSQELANRVIKKLQLDQDPEFNPNIDGRKSILSYLNPLNWLPTNSALEAAAQGEDVTRRTVLTTFGKRLGVEPIGLSTAMNITFESYDAAKAQRIANAVATAYVEDQLEAKFDATKKATEWLSSRIAELSTQSQQADAAVAEYKAEHNITTTVDGGSVVDQQVASVNNQLVLARTDLAEKQANYSRLADLARQGKAADSGQAVASPVIAALRAQESALNGQMADLSSRYGPRHPKILDLQAQKETLDAKIAQEVQRLVDAARNDMQIASSHVGSLQSSLRGLEAQNAGQNKASVRLTQLQSAASSARSMYQAFLGRLNQMQDQSGIQTPDARIISSAQLPEKASFPKKGMMIAASVPAGLILGLMLAFAAERLDPGFRTASQIESMLQIPVLAVIPEIGSGGDKAPANPAEMVLARPTSSFSEAIRSLQLGIKLSNVDEPPKVIVVASSVPGEGKTTLAVSLARFAARAGARVVILDGDFRRPTVGETMGVTPQQGGLIEALTRQFPWQHCIAADPRSDVQVLPCLKAPPNAADLLSSEAMRSLVSDLRKAYDLVIIDSAPVLPVSDTKILGRLADMVLFAARWEKTPREAVANAVRSLMDAHVRVSGIALTRADSDRSLYYIHGYQNYRGYGKYYHE